MFKFYEDCSYGFRRFFRNWIYPARRLRNLLINRYDLVRLPGIPKTEYADTVERLFLANMTLLKEFMELEHPEKYVSWYGDDEISGPKWQAKHHPWIADSDKYEGKFIFDLIKEVYEWYTQKYPELVRRSAEALKEWNDTRDGFPNLAESYLEIHDQLEKQLFEESQKYLHLVIELRPHMWI